MTTRADKALKAQKEKHHAILRELVQEPSNKTCADCLAKGPRWSSWSLGVFVCIRCAGIHRNLGVHISKVKSVDLDSWSAEQIEHILKWGNKRAGEYFECFLPKDFTRPQGNHAVESFIRNKYEKKLYMRKDGEPEPNSPSKLNRLHGTTLSTEKDKKVQSVNKKRDRPEKKAEEKPISNTILNMSSQNQATNLKVDSQSQPNAHHVKSSSMNDLLSLDHPGPTTPDVKPAASSNDLLNFGLFAEAVPSANPDPFTGFGNTTSNGSDPFQTSVAAPETVKSEPAKSTKESIMSLYSNTGSQQQNMYGVPGRVYMPQQQPQTNMAYNARFQMTQMKNQLQQMNYNTPQQQQQQQQQAYFQQVYNQTPMQQGYMQPQYNANMHNGQVNFSASNTPSMPGNMMSTPNQMNMMQQRMVQGNMQHGYNVANNVTSNNTWSTGMTGQHLQQQRQQQQQQQQQQRFMMNGTANPSMNFNGYNPSGMGTNMGHTMNSQLWN